MKTIERYLGRELTIRDYIVTIVLAFTFFIGLKLLLRAIYSTPQTFIASKATRIVADSNPMRGKCAARFYFFQNEAYAFCYPDTLTPFITHNAISKLDITFEDKSGNKQLTVVAQYRKESTSIYDSCLIKETSFVADRALVREKKRVNNKENCEVILSIASTIQTGRELPFWMLYQNVGVQDEATFVSQYTEIEKSLQIK